MLISHKHKFITIDIPKTATRSLRETFVPQNIIDIVGEPNLNADFYQHGTAQQCRDSLQKINKNFSDYFSFVIVRNPWDRYYSFFKYFKEYAEKYKNKDASIKWNAPEINQGKMCEELFANKTDEIVLRNIIINNECQSDYYSDENDEIMVSHIAKFENLNKEFELLCNQVNVNYSQLFHENKSFIKSSYYNIYTKKTIELVAEKEKSVIELKGYEF
jgi:chondroitin 4-sulfotransferase 11